MDSKQPTFEGYSQEDWDAVCDNPELTDEQLANMRPFAEVFPELAAKMRASRGAQKAPTKVATTLRLDRDVIDTLRASGKGWQSRANAILRNALWRAQTDLVSEVIPLSAQHQSPWRAYRRGVRVKARHSQLRSRSVRAF